MQGVFKVKKTETNEVKLGDWVIKKGITNDLEFLYKGKYQFTCTPE